VPLTRPEWVLPHSQRERESERERQRERERERETEREPERATEKERDRDFLRKQRPISKKLHYPFFS
jgi:hypothetical protein